MSILEYLLEKYPDKNWDYWELSRNPTISLKYIKNNLVIDRDVNLYDNVDINLLLKRWYWYEISERVTYKEFIDNPELPWNYLGLSINENIPIEYIKNSLNDNTNNWNWRYISERVKYKDFINNPDLPWDYEGLSCHTFDCEFIKLAKNIMNVIINDEKYIAKVYNPNRMRSVKSLCELEELKADFGWTDEEFDKYVK